MITFQKGDSQESPFVLDFSRFLAEMPGVTLSEIVSFTRVYGDVVVGIGARAPALAEGNTVVLFWLSGGTANTWSEFEILVSVSNGARFDKRFRVQVLNSL